MNVWSNNCNGLPISFLISYWFSFLLLRMKFLQYSLSIINQSTRMFRCSICNSNLSTKDSLRRHERSLHRHEKFHCQECGKQYTSLSGLTAHINSMHRGIRYKCNQCDKTFSQPSVRNIHIQSVHKHIYVYFFLKF